MRNFRLQTSLNRYQLLLLVLYLIGFALMLAFNVRCYAGTPVGMIGWAAVWPLSVPAYIVEFVIQPGGVLAAGCPVL